VVVLILILVVLQLEVKVTLEVMEKALFISMVVEAVEQVRQVKPLQTLLTVVMAVTEQRHLFLELLQPTLAVAVEDTILVLVGLEVLEVLEVEVLVD